MKSNAKPGRVKLTLHYMDCLENTNDYMREHCATFPHGSVVYTSCQTNGRGRCERQWIAPKGEALFASFLYKNVPPQSLSVLPLVCGVAVTRMLEKIAPCHASLKWPNDVLLNGKKVCGILCESVVLGSRADVVCGIGINLLVTRKTFDSLGLFHAGSILSQTGTMCSVEKAASILSQQMEHVWNEWISDGFSGGLQKEYEARCLTLHRTVLLLQNSLTREVYAEGILPDGRLLCSDQAGKFAVASGEASIRGISGYAQ